MMSVQDWFEDIAKSNSLCSTLLHLKFNILPFFKCLNTLLKKLVLYQELWIYRIILGISYQCIFMLAFPGTCYQIDAT